MQPGLQWLCVACLLLTWLLSIVVPIRSGWAGLNVPLSARNNAVLTLHFSYTTSTCHTPAESTLPQPTTAPPRCTLSVRVFHHLPHPAWHAVHNDSVTLAASPYSYPIPTSQLRCHHQVVLWCALSHSNNQLPVIPAAGFFYAPSGRRQPSNTFVILDSTNCVTTSTETASSIHTYGFCLLADKAILPPSAPTVMTQPVHNLSQSHICSAQRFARALVSPAARSPPPRPSLRSSTKCVTAEAPSLTTRGLIWLHRRGRGDSAERDAQRKDSDSQSHTDEHRLVLLALHLFRLWLFVLSGASVCSAAIAVCFIIRLTKCIEMY